MRSLRFTQRVSISICNIRRVDYLIEAQYVFCEVRTEVCMYCELILAFHVLLNSFLLVPCVQLIITRFCTLLVILIYCFN